MTHVTSDAPLPVWVPAPGQHASGWESHAAATQTAPSCVASVYLGAWSPGVSALAPVVRSDGAALHGAAP